MNIEGKTIIFKNEYGYTTSVSKKNQDGSYDKMYLSIQLPKGTEVENKTIIDIQEGFLSFYKDKNGIAKPKIVVMKYKLHEEVATRNKEKLAQDDLLPF